MTEPKKRPGAPKGRKRGGASLPCPTCQSATKVVRTWRGGSGVVSRVRRCTGCEKSMISHESVSDA